MGTRISELPLETVPLDADFVPAVKSGVTSRFTWTSIKAFLLSWLESVSVTTIFMNTSGVKTYTKSIPGTTASTQAGASSIAHGLTGDKIKAISAKVFYITNGGVFPNHPISDPGFSYYIYHDATNIVIQNMNTYSANILSKQVVVTITYEA